MQYFTHYRKFATKIQTIFKLHSILPICFRNYHTVLYVFNHE